MDLLALTENEETVLIVGFFDIRGFSKWSEGRVPREMYDFATELFERTGAHISEAGGYLIKSIGDAGLFIFPAGEPDKAVQALLEMKNNCDAWLKQIDYPEVMSVKVQIGPVACGYMLIEGEKRFDIYGKTVNRAAMMKGHVFALSADLFDELSENVQQNFSQFNTPDDSQIFIFEY
jgi:adenylate cyclase|tara:strand:- start:800 stop:1330 length:531 start_codon:yes stop_codon:yes gene_type:complete